MFCGAGGCVDEAASRAGFVTGVDSARSRAIRSGSCRLMRCIRRSNLASFDFIWASPPCQRFTNGAAARMAKGYDYLTISRLPASSSPSIR